jgi:hypothetical protein
MNREPLWLTVPQAVVLEVTGDIEAVLALTDDDPAILLIKANRLVSDFLVIPLDADADDETRRDALRRFHEAKSAGRGDRGSRYSQALQRVHERLVAGVATKASRTLGGRSEDVDPAEFTRVELQGVDAVDNRTGTVSLHDLRIDGYTYIESLTGKPIEVASGSLSDELAQIPEDVSPVEKSDCLDLGDPLPKVIEWARSKWGDDFKNLPSRSELLQIFRKQFRRVQGVSEKTMREVRRQLAPKQSRRGGAPMHRHKPGK